MTKLANGIFSFYHTANVCLKVKQICYSTHRFLSDNFLKNMSNTAQIAIVMGSKKRLGNHARSHSNFR